MSHRERKEQAATMIVPRSTSEELPSATEAVHLLHNGDHMDAEEFHRRYLAMPQVNKAELIEGVVYMPSPVSHESHGKPHGMLMVFLGVYAGFTPGVTFSDNATVRLDACNELQPDGSLMIQTDCGGQTRIVDGYIVGAPELIVEVAASTVSIDRHAKWLAYQRNSVREYLLWRVEDVPWTGSAGTKVPMSPWQCQPRACTEATFSQGCGCLRQPCLRMTFRSYCIPYSKAWPVPSMPLSSLACSKHEPQRPTRLRRSNDERAHFV